MPRTAVLGLGAMGSRMARRLINAGHEVVVWNRNADAAQALVDAGAQLASSPREAALNVDAVITMLRDDEASRIVWSDAETGILSGMRKGAIAIESSTLTPAREWAADARHIGILPVEAPVSGSRPQAESGQLLYFLGGDAADVGKATSILAPLGASFHHVGPVGDAAVVKLVTNTMLALQVGAWAELLPMMEREGLDIDVALKALAMTSSWAPVAGYLTMLMRSDNHAPQFPINLIKKDLDYVGTLGGDVLLPLSGALKSRFNAAIDAGIGGENMSALVKLQRS
ncbi:NAD(P)-dependent oxidoreductase [Rhizobium sp. CSW-27]|uniref:NAD(P)-dependent oxidoreductase n=1 Tax=Rhizobium sp. CSW-27 TaxID=2839985 RepID=UPI001C00C16A|nr:NAD(P)-dependent oxidoreductase [Rhizobium sp. CSW-27]MBT9372964.1 NAD(P)-dependent oxidoreductase [Rhizobium sp. CSW-27]